MLMQGVRETLAGRVALMRLHAMTLPELMDRGDQEYPSPLIELLLRPNSIVDVLDVLVNPVLGLTVREASARQWSEYLLRWGGMPALLQPQWSDQDRMEWLRDYQELYLQRDLGDLARLTDLDPFARA